MQVVLPDFFKTLKFFLTTYLEFLKTLLDLFRTYENSSRFHEGTSSFLQAVTLEWDGGTEVQFAIAFPRPVARL